MYFTHLVHFREIKILFVILFVGLFKVTGLYAQDIQLAQFYAAQTYLSPSFAGGTHQTRAMAHQRLQWPRLDAKYITSLFSFDKYFSKYNSGFGAVLLRDQQGTGEIVSYSIDLQYAYEVHISENLSFRPGLQAGYVFRSSNYSNLTVPSQYDPDSDDFVGGHSYGDALTTYFDFASGGIVYTPEFWIGYFGHHLNRPDQAVFVDGSKLPMRHTFVGGYKIRLKKISDITFSDMEHEASITPTFHYKSQGKNDQIDIGIYMHYDHLLAGFWYRGIPFKKFKPEFHNNESMVFTAGWRYHRWSLTYSFDWVVSKLAMETVGGAHEINITFVNLSKYKKQRVMKRIPCPNIYIE